MRWLHEIASFRACCSLRLLDLVNPAAAERLGLSGYCVLLQAGGSEAVMERYTRELGGAEIREDDEIWPRVREFTPDWLREHPKGAVVRVSTTLQGVSGAMRGAQADPLWRVPEMASCTSIIQTRRKLGLAVRREQSSLLPKSAKRSLTLWPQPGSDFPVMQKIKQLFDPKLS